MAATSAPTPAAAVRPANPPGGLAEAVHNIQQQQLLALLLDGAYAGDLDALGTSGGKAKKGGGAKGAGGKGCGGKGPNSTAGINGGCW